MPKPRHASPQPHRLAKQFAALCERKGQSPRAASFLADFPEATASDRVEVMLLDLARRWSAGEDVRVEEFLKLDAEIAADENLTLELIIAESDCQAQQSIGPSVDELTARFPRLAEPISRLLSQRTDDDRFPPYRQLVQLMFDDDLTLRTLWGAQRGTSSGFGDHTQRVGISSHADGTGSFLAKCWPFSKLPSQVVRLIESFLITEEFDVGQYLMRQGEPGTSLMVLCGGDVEISTLDDQGQHRVLARTSQLQVLGEMALLTDQPRSANAVAITPVRALLLPAERFHELAGRFPEISVVLTLLLAERLGLPDRDDVLTGKTFDRYRIASRLGRGGMSVVYEAEHVDTGQHVALKMMSHRLVYNQEALDQFQTEADLIESFDHPNIVRMFGRFAAFHTYFIVMEFAGGVTLRERINQNGPLPDAEFRNVFSQIVSALHYAHSVGVIHRDVKPANIMLTPDGVVKLMDFGLATPTSVAASTNDDKVVGTPRYMAPEQFVGGQLTAAADLFSLGCVGYEMLTGEPLIVENDVIELLRLHANWQIPDLKQPDDGLSDEICSVVQQCLPLDSTERRIDYDLLASWAK